jgi:hypothetical protein
MCIDRPPLLSIDQGATSDNEMARTNLCPATKMQCWLDHTSTAQQGDGAYTPTWYALCQSLLDELFSLIWREGGQIKKYEV